MVAEASVTILLALLAGAITVVNPLVARGNLISGFRQAWINDQREDLAIVAAKAVLLSSNTTTDWAKDIGEYAAAASRIRLRQNPSLLRAGEWDGVLSEIENIHRDIWVNRGQQFDLTVRIKQVLLQSQRPLKENWNKTRDGETVHYWSLILAGVVIVVAVVALALSAMHESERNQNLRKNRVDTIIVN